MKLCRLPLLAVNWFRVAENSEPSRERTGNEAEARTGENWGSPGTQSGWGTRPGLFMLERVSSGRSGLHDP